MLRATLHPGGLAPMVRNLSQWRSHALRRVRRQLERTADDGLADLLLELESYGRPTSSTPPALADDLVVPLQLTTPYGDLDFLYAATVFGSPHDVTLDEIAIETFFPANSATAGILRSLAKS